MFYKKILEYYLTSNEWDILLTGFFEGYDHHYDRYEGTEYWGRIYLCSEIYMEYCHKLEIAGGSFLSDLNISEAQFRKYFTDQYGAEQRFAALFGIWWGLRKEQIHSIANLHYRKHCLCLLNYYLCCPEADIHINLAEIQKYHYSGRYFAEIYKDPPLMVHIKPDRIVPVLDVCTDSFDNFL